MENRLVQERIEKLKKLQETGIDPYPYSYAGATASTTTLEKYKHLKVGESSKEKVSILGRMMTWRDMGKASFAHLQDQEGQIQVYFREDELKKKYALLQFIDIGDFLGVRGEVFRTKKGELTIGAKEVTFLSKSIHPLPDKFHGLQDTELRYRQRYLDLITNPEVKKIFSLRTKIIRAVREFLDTKGFMEVEIPTLQPLYGGANAKPFKTHINAWDLDLYLSISPELYLKRLIVGGYEKVYTLCKNFRNEGVDKTHNPEFTMMECYQVGVDYNGMMELTEDLYVFVAKKVLGTTEFTYQGKKINLKKPWKRMTMYEALKKYAEIDVKKLSDKELFKHLEKNKIENNAETPRGIAIAALFEALCEASLVQPIFITDHPRETTPLCKLKRGDSSLIERFEPYINGWEMGNGYSELTDPLLQKEFFEEQAKSDHGDETTHQVDTDYVHALEYGLPPTGGVGLGIDRMVLLLANASSLREVILFPTMKPEELSKP